LFTPVVDVVVLDVAVVEVDAEVVEVGSGCVVPTGSVVRGCRCRVLIVK
jgi:hypothetical protein